MSPTSTPVTPTATTQPVPDIFDTVRALGRGVNLGNMLDAPTEGEWGLTVQEEYFDLIKQARFNSARIPIRWSAHAAKAAPYTIDPLFFARVDQVIAWALERDLLVIIDFHHYLELMSDPQAHQARYLALWQQIAEHYRAYPITVLFELLNEPNDQLDAASWNQLSRQALSRARQSNPLRDVIIGGAGSYAYDQLANLELPESDRHIIATFHYYNPFEFTHQGAWWAAGMDKYLGTLWQASEAERAAVDANFDQVDAWAKAHNRPVLLGEFGAYSKAGMDSRAGWTACIARSAEKRGFAWAYWEFCADFGVYDPHAKEWRALLLKALIP